MFGPPVGAKYPFGVLYVPRVSEYVSGPFCDQQQFQ